VLVCEAEEQERQQMTAPHRIRQPHRIQQARRCRPEQGRVETAERRTAALWRWLSELLSETREAVAVARIPKMMMLQAGQAVQVNQLRELRRSDPGKQHAIWALGHHFAPNFDQYWNAMG
jgi:hypothetical protein